MHDVWTTRDGDEDTISHIEDDLRCEMAIRMLLSEVHPTLYAYGRDLALSDYETYIHNIEQRHPCWKHNNQIEALAKQKIRGSCL